MLVIVQALDFDISRNTQTNKFVDDLEVVLYDVFLEVNAQFPSGTRIAPIFIRP